METFYRLLMAPDSAQPLHAVFAHLTMGLVMAGFIFFAAFLYTKKSAFRHTAGHAMALAFIGLLPTVLMGLFQWGYAYQWLWLPPAQGKLVLTLLLALLLCITIWIGRQPGTRPRRLAGAHLLCLMVVLLIGYHAGQWAHAGKERLADNAAVERQALAGDASPFSPPVSGSHVNLPPGAPDPRHAAP